MTLDCAICGSNRLTSYFSKNNYTTMRCETCEVTFVDPMPTEEQVAKIYQDDYFASHYTDVGSWLRGNTSSGEIVGAKISALVRVAEIQAILSDLGPRDHVKFLELGSSYGIVLEAGESLGWDVCGVEINKTLADYCREAMGLKVISQSIEKAVALLPHDFDAIALYHIIEHVRDPVALVSQLFSLLQPGGIVVIQTPNIESYNSMEQGAAWEYFKPPEHLWYFSENSLKGLLKRAGFGPVNCKGSDSKTMLMQIIRVPIFRVVRTLGISLNLVRDIQVVLAIIKKFHTKSLNSDDVITVVGVKH